MLAGERQALRAAVMAGRNGIDTTVAAEIHRQTVRKEERVAKVQETFAVTDPMKSACSVQRARRDGLGGPLTRVAREALTRRAAVPRAVCSPSESLAADAQADRVRAASAQCVQQRDAPRARARHRRGGGVHSAR